MSLALSGIGVSRGIVMGKAHVLQRGQLEIPVYVIPKKFIEDEVDRFEEALESAKLQLSSVRRHIPTNTPADVASFIDTHLLMLEDSMVSSAPIDLIRNQQCNAEWALKQQRDALVKVFDDMDDAYLRTRRDDVDHVVNRIQSILLNQSEHAYAGLENRLKDHILVADDLTPADTVVMQHCGVAGFVTEYGGPTSHTSILARSLGIPALVGVRNARRYILDDEPIVIDGEQGVLVANADARAERYYRKRQREEKRHRAELRKIKDKPAITQDGVHIALHANIELPEDIPLIKRVGAEGVGLYRTEFLYMNRPDTPDEEEQLAAYLHVVNTLKGAPITIRTLDLGADKQVNGGATDRPAGSNPALGLRAVRLCLKDPSLFRPQLRAILRASAHGPVRLMIPMLSTITELNQVLQLIGEAKTELAHEGRKFDEQMPVGGMIEVPAAALSAPMFARHLDFLSIGTNDLIQYTLAIDRIDDEVNYLYDPVHPGVLQLIHLTIQAGKKAGIPVSMCGEMAGDKRFVRLLLGMGLREFSMHPASLLEIKRIVNSSHAARLAKLARRVLRGGAHKDIVRQIEEMNVVAP